MLFCYFISPPIERAFAAFSRNHRPPAAASTQLVGAALRKALGGLGPWMSRGPSDKLGEGFESESVHEKGGHGR